MSARGGHDVVEQLSAALAGLIECHGPLGHWGRADPPCARYTAALQALEEVKDIDA